MPDPAFVNALEWQLERELRRAARFEPIRGSTRTAARRGLGLVTLALVSGLLGVAGLAGAQQVRASLEARPIVRIIELKEKAAEIAWQGAAVALTDAQAREKGGDSSIEGVARAKKRLAESILQRTKAALDLEEARSAGRRPRDDLSAPLIGGRDFVRDRLRADHAAATEQLSLAQVALNVAIQRYEMGLVTHDATSGAKLDVQLAELRIKEASSKLTAREDFLNNRKKAIDAEREGVRIDVSYGVGAAMARADIARQRLKVARLRNEAGLTSQAELRQVTEEMAEAEAALAIAQAELKSFEEDAQQ